MEAFTRYLQEKIGILYPVNPNLKALLDKILSDPRWDLKFIGMQIIIEGLALAAFNTLKMTAKDPLLKQLVHLVIRDEARHVTFGVNYLEDFVQTLSHEEKEERAHFAFEACVVMRERLISTEVFEHFGWDVEAAREQVLSSTIMAQFRNLLFTRIMPNLKRIGYSPSLFGHGSRSWVSFSTKTWWMMVKLTGQSCPNPCTTRPARACSRCLMPVW